MGQTVSVGGGRDVPTDGGCDEASAAGAVEAVEGGGAPWVCVGGLNGFRGGPGAALSWQPPALSWQICSFPSARVWRARVGAIDGT